MYCTPEKILTARIQHRCEFCYERIEAGQKYVRWASVDETWFTNKMHPECLSALQEDSDWNDFEYAPGQGERPPLTPALAPEKK